MADNRKRKVGPDGRNEYIRYVRLEDGLTSSAAWRALSGNAIKVYVALSRFYIGHNNGDLFFSVDVGAAETGLSPNTVWRCLNELDALGFIKPVQKGYFRQKGGPSTQWRLTHWASPSCRMSPTRDYLKWTPPEGGNKTRSQKLASAVAKSAMPLETPSATVANIETDTRETPLVSVDPSIAIIGTQVICQGHSEARGGKQGGNAPETASGVSKNEVGPDLLDRLRASALAVIEGGEPGEQTKLALSAGIPGGTLSKFLGGRGLNRTHFINLQLALQKQPTRKAA